MAGESEEDKDSVVGNLVRDEIPMDLAFEILNRLEPKSLMRFKCVSNGWLSMIRSQVFVNSFITKSQTRPHFLVSVRNAENRAFLLSSSHFETERSNTCLVNLANPEMVSDTYHFRFVLRATSLHTNLLKTMDGVDLAQCSSVNGLFGFSQPSHPGRFMICNPTTRQIITLPDIQGRKTGMHMFLGYDPVGNVYKAVCSLISDCGYLQVYKVLTLGDGNLSWRDIKTRILGIRVPYNVVTNRICLNGKVYFGGWSLTEDKIPMMICFDVRDERITCVKGHPVIVRDGLLINYNGKLASVVRCKSQRQIRFDIIVLDDFNTCKLLRKEFLFNPILTDLSRATKLNIIGMSKTDEFIFVPTKLPHKGEPLYIYYYSKGGGIFIRRVKFDGFEEFGCSHTSDDEHCVCQISFSPEHFETLLSL